MKQTSTFDDLIYRDVEPIDHSQTEQLLMDTRATFGTDAGKRMLYHILKPTMQYESAMTGNSQTFYNLGAVDWGRSLLDLIALADPETHQWWHRQRENYVAERHLKKIET